MRPTARRAAAKSPRRSCSYTRRLSCARPRTASACQLHSTCTANPSAGWMRQVTRHTAPLSASVPTGSVAASTAPAARWPHRVCGKRGRRKRSSTPIARPIHTTGWGKAGGSANSRSSTKPHNAAATTLINQSPFVIFTSFNTFSVLFSAHVLPSSTKPPPSLTRQSK